MVISKRAQLLNLIIKRRNPAAWVDEWLAAGDDQARLEALVAGRRSDDALEPPRLLNRRWNVERHELSSGHLDLLRSKVGTRRRVMLYFHGGYYAVGPSTPEWLMVAALCHRNDLDMVMVHYPRIPEHRGEESIASAGAAWDFVAERYGAPNTVVLGASAGGGLATLLVQRLATERAPLPCAVALSSPWLDLTSSHPQARTRERTDIMISIDGAMNNGAMWAGGDPANPKYSPFCGRVDGLPPIHMQVGMHEILRGEVEDWAAKVRGAGGQIELMLDPGGQHCGMFMPTPEGWAIRSSLSVFFDRHPLSMYM